MPSFASEADLFYSLIREYSQGKQLVRMTRSNDRIRRIARYEMIFEAVPLSGTPPVSSTHDELIHLYDLLRSGQAHMNQISQDVHRTLIEVEVADAVVFNPPDPYYTTPPRYKPSDPTYLLPPQSYPSTFTFMKPPPEQKKKTPTIVRKIQKTVEIGYRDFVYLKKGNLDRPVLLSRNGVPWPRYEPLVATCQGDPFKDHDAPHYGCECGIYAYNKPNNSQLKPDACVWGEIALWGRTFICPNGFRAEYAYPQNIFVKDVGTKTVARFALALEDAYGVPVHLVKERDGLKASDVMANLIADLLKSK